MFLFQTEEVRSRLNVDVTVASGSPSAPAPIESFADMVNMYLADENKRFFGLNC